jgi:hypothetical protein
MAVSLRSYRQGDWKLTFNRGLGGAGPDELTVDQAALYNLADDLGETQDLSETHPDKTQQLFTSWGKYFEQRKLKPLAARIAEQKAKAKAQSQKGRKNKKQTPQRSSTGRQDVELTKEQQAEVAALKKEFGQRRSELQKQLNDLLTDEQKQARETAKKKALADGKGGVKLRTAMDKAPNLTPTQQRHFNELRQKLGELTRSHRAELEEVRQRLENTENR